MSNSKKYSMTIDINVLKHLGINLYSNTAAVLSEAVANAWDADAELVQINIKSEEEDKIIIIKDNGIGMSEQDVNNKFLKVGYEKRENDEQLSIIHNRPVMGRKGIGKLSLFSVAKIVEVYTKTESGEKNAFRMNSDDIFDAQSSDSLKEYVPEVISTESLDIEKGTKIILRSLKKRLVNVEEGLRKRLARRFSIIGQEHSFSVILNDSEINVEDRDYFHKIEYLFYYGDESQQYEDYASNATYKEKRQNILDGGYEVKGWLGLVKESGQLQDDSENLNKVTLLMRGKVAKEDILEMFREGGLYIKFLFGEISADFLDDDDKDDIATSSRQDIVKGDERFEVLREFILKELKYIERKRVELKARDAEEDIQSYPIIDEWYKLLKGDTKRKAKSLFAKINQIAMNEEHKAQLYSHGVIAFQSLRYREALDAIEDVSLDNINEFLVLFKEFDDIEAALYYKITKERLQIIEKLRSQVEDLDALEKVLQSFLFAHLWLLDPSWERATESVYMEEKASKAFNEIDEKLTEEEENGRIDLRYKKTSGKHIIIELKRASVKTSSYKLLEQTDKYRSALRKLLRANGEKYPNIEVICLVGKELKGWEDAEKKQEDIESMEAKNTRVILYQQLVYDSYNSYKEYIDAREGKDVSQTLKIIREIEGSIIQY